MKLPAFFFLRFQTKESVLRVNKSEVAGEIAFNGDLLEIEENREYSKEEKAWF